MSINRSRSRGKKDKDPASPSMGAMNGLHSRFPSSLKGNSLFFFQPPTQAPSTSVDLSSTLSQFGFAGFDSWRYVSQYFADHPIESSIEHHLELVDRKNITARALRTFVTEHFGHFIDTAKQIQFVENDMSVLHNLLIEYRKALRENMELTSPPDEDERLRIERDAEKIMQKMSSFNVDQDLISLEEVLHELGSLVFERLFEQAINLIENVSEKFSDLKVEMTDHANLSTLDKLKKEFDDIVIRLVENLTNELRLPTIKLNEQRRISSLLIRLGKWNIAIDIFLQSRSDALTVDIRAIVLHGDLALYVDELANLLCTSVVSACQEFRKMFSESKLLSLFIAWAVKELQEFARIFKRQVFFSDTPMQKVGECLKKAFVAIQTLDDHGLKLSFVLTNRFASWLKDRIRRNLERLGQTLSDAVEVDNWSLTSLIVKQINRRKSIRPDGAVATILLKISSSTKVLYSEIEKFMMDMRSVLNMKLYPALTDLLYSQAVEGITRKLEEFILVMTKTSQAKKLKKEQFMAIVCNAYYLADDLVPRMKMTVDRLFERKPIEIEAFQIKLQRYFNAQRDSFSQHFAPSWLRNVIDWSLLVNSRYTLDKVNFNVSEIRPADQFFSFVGLLGTIKIDFEKSISKDVSKKVVIRSFVEVLGCLLSDKYSKALTSITLYGLHCFMIDLKFTVAWFTDLADEKLRALAREICNRAVSIFQEQNPSVSVAENLLSDAEYESMVQSVFSHQSVKCIKEYKPSPR